MTTVPSGTGVRILLFASYAERLGQDVLTLPIASGSTAGEVLERVRALPGGDRLPRRPLLALNLAHVGPDARVAAGDELAILPPLAGG